MLRRRNASLRRGRDSIAFGVSAASCGDEQAIQKRLRDDFANENHLRSPHVQKNFLTFATEDSRVVTLVSQLAAFDHHFFLDFIFH